jgi:hypothetical protein
MVERRNLVGGGAIAGIIALVAAVAPGADAAQDVSKQYFEMTRAANEMRMLLERHYDAPWTGVAQIRNQQRIWLRTTQKFPDFIEIGVGIWEGLYDWHVRFQQPVNVSRAADGRYVMAFMFTTLILRTDVDPGYVGPAFDNDRRPGQQ